MYIRDSNGYLTKSGWRFVILPSVILTLFWIFNGLCNPLSNDPFPDWMLWLGVLLFLVATLCAIIVELQVGIATFRALKQMRKIGLQCEDVINRLEDFLKSVVCSYPIVICSFAYFFERIYFLDPNMFKATPISNRFDFFYQAFLMMITVDVPQWEGLALRTVVMIAVLIGYVFTTIVIAILVSLLIRHAEGNESRTRTSS